MNIQKKLKVIKSVNFGRWKDIMEIVSLYNSNEIELLTVEFFDSWVLEHEKDLKKLKNWSTFDSCVDINLSPEVVKVVIWEGDSYNGFRKNRRFSATFSTPEKLNPYKQHIERKFRGHLEYIFEEEERLRKENRLKEIEEELNL